MSFKMFTTVLVLMLVSYISAVPLETASVPAPQSVDQTQSFVPHTMFPYAETAYPNSGPFDGYLVPAGSIPTSGKPENINHVGLSNANQKPEYYPTSTSLVAAPTALSVALKLFAKVGLFFLGGVALLLVGGLFTTAVCSLTPICTISFAGVRGFDQDTMRSLVTPDKISAAADFVQDALGKYQRLQRAANNY